MGWQSYYVLGLTLVMLVTIAWGKGKLDAIGLLLMVALVGAGVLDYHAAVEGFGNKAILTIAGLYVVGEGLTRTGAVEFLAHLLLRFSRGSSRKLIFLTCVFSAVVSSFLNNTAVVIVMLPVLLGIAQRAGVPPSHLLMPLSFSSLVGGMTTLIGTSTNILVSGVAETLDQPPIGMFEMSLLGVVVTAAAILYLTFLTPVLLPDRPTLSSLMTTQDRREYLTELVIGPTSPLIGRPYSEIAQLIRAKLLFYVRDEAMVWPPHDGHIVQKDDVLMLRGGVDDIADLQARLGLKYAAGESTRSKDMSFVELAISPHSPLVGRRAEELELWRDYRAVTIAVLRAGAHIRDRVSKMVLRSGDLLLVMADEDAERRLRSSSDFYLLTGTHHQVKLRHRGRNALAITGLVVALFAMSSFGEMKYLPQPFIALLGAIGMIATGCVTPRRVYRTIDWPILIFIVGTLALGKGMEATGCAQRIAEVIVDLLARHGEWAVLSGFVLLCIVMNTLVAHSAVAVLLTPIAVQTAQVYAHAQGLPAAEAAAFLRAAILAIAFGGSLCFATPIGHQVNLMVMGPGGYRYGDFVRLGLPLSLIAWAILSFGLPILEGL